MSSKADGRARCDIFPSCLEDTGDYKVELIRCEE